MNYDHDPQTIAVKIQGIIHDSLQQMAPVKTVQIKQTSNQVLSPEAQQALIDRDLVREEFKVSNSPDDLRFYKNMKKKT